MRFVDGLQLGENPLGTPAQALKPFRLISAVLTTEGLKLGWDDFFSGVDSLSPDLLDMTSDALLRYGISREIVSSFLLYALMHRLLKSYPEIVAQDPDVDLSPQKIWRILANTIECELIASSNIELVLNKLKLPRQININKLDLLLLWAQLDLIFPDDSEDIYRLSVPFGCIEEHYPDVMAWRANLYYNFGRSGDDDLACEMAVRAAFRGSVYAWKLLAEWASKDDVLDVFFRLGPTLAQDTGMELPAAAQFKVSALIKDLD